MAKRTKARKDNLGHYWLGFPARIKIGPYIIAITIEPQIRDGTHVGEYMHGQEIRFRFDQLNSAFCLDTVLHEIGHGIYKFLGLTKKCPEETVVGGMAAAWTMVFRENPRLVEWIAKVSKDK